jgi:hypothetical protein
MWRMRPETKLLCVSSPANRRRIMKALLVIGTIVTALATAGVAGAGGNGAYVYTNTTCSDTVFGLVCVDERSVTNITDTPSGNESYVVNGTLDFSFANRLNGCTYSTSARFHTNFEDQDGEAQSHGSRYVTTSQVGCGGAVETCLTTVTFHYGRGEIQFDRTDVACTTE